MYAIIHEQMATQLLKTRSFLILLRRGELPFRSPDIVGTKEGTYKIIIFWRRARNKKIPPRRQRITGILLEIFV